MRYFALSLAGCLVAGSARAAFLSAATHDGHTYYLLTSASWRESEAEAVRLGGHLATVDDQAEQDFLYQTFGRFGGVPRYLWIGLNDAADEGRFVWSSGAAVTYTNWAFWEPNDAGGVEDYVYISAPNDPRPYFWNDFEGAGRVDGFIHGVAEVSTVAVPGPPAALSFAAGMVCLLGLWSRRLRRPPGHPANDPVDRLIAHP